MAMKALEEEAGGGSEQSCQEDLETSKHAQNGVGKMRGSETIIFTF